MISKPAAEEAIDSAHLPPGQAETVLGHYESAQIDALKRALLAAAFFALLALWFASDLPAVPLAKPAPIPESAKAGA